MRNGAWQVVEKVAAQWWVSRQVIAG